MKVVKFYADWCSPCRAYQKHWDEVVLENVGNNIEFISVNVDERDTTGFKRLVGNVPSIPFTILVKDEEIVKTQVGLMTTEQLTNFIAI